MAASNAGLPVVCLYVRDWTSTNTRPPGGARQWWLNSSLSSLNASLIDRFGGGITLKTSDERGAVGAIEDLLKDCDIAGVFWNRRYSPHDVEADKSLKEWLKAKDIAAESFNGHLLKEPWTVCTKDGRPYRVFTPFWKSLSSDIQLSSLTDRAECKVLQMSSEALQDWDLHPTKPDWSAGLDEAWAPGEDGARKQLEHFFENAVSGYDENRNRPDKRGTSRMSPHLSFGEISVQRIWADTLKVMSDRPNIEADGWSFLRELGWRDFSFNLLFYADDLADKNWNTKFDAFPWERDDGFLDAWQSGQTGYPIVDAGMRELWHTGWMHNRVRMIVGSFLVKHMRHDWRHGEDWFWDTLVDADPASNPASWQWVAGSGADAAPYFRVFNPITQGQKFDPKGDYVRKWVPELKSLPTKYLNEPWVTPKEVLKQAGVLLGKTYPKPIVDHKMARQAALQAYEAVKNAKDAA